MVADRRRHRRVRRDMVVAADRVQAAVFARPHFRQEEDAARAGDLHVDLGARRAAHREVQLVARAEVVAAAARRSGRRAAWRPPSRSLRSRSSSRSGAAHDGFRQHAGVDHVVHAQVGGHGAARADAVVRADRVGAAVGARRGFGHVQVARGAVDAQRGVAARRAEHLEVQLRARLAGARTSSTLKPSMCGARRWARGWSSWACAGVGDRQRKQGQRGHHGRGQGLSGCCHGVLHGQSDVNVTSLRPRGQTARCANARCAPLRPRSRKCARPAAGRTV